MLEVHHIFSAAYAAVMKCCEYSNVDYFSSYGHSTFLQCYSVALYICLFNGSANTGFS